MNNFDYDTSDATHELYDSWDIDSPWQLNPGGIRHTSQDLTCLYSSPGYENSFSKKLDIEEPWAPKQWMYLANFCPSNLVLGACFPEPCVNMKAVPGSLKINSLAKCHKMVWKAGRKVAILSDKDGNEHILVASRTHEESENGVVNPSPQLPEGWKITQRTLDKDFVLFPEGDSRIETSGGDRANIGSFACGYTIVWD